MNRLSDAHLAPHDVHVWSAQLDLTPTRLSELELYLSDDERGRAERYYFQKDRDHFVAARGLLRILLSRYLALDPAELTFRYGVYGKPELAPAQNARAIAFNVAHSHGLGLFAVSLGREIGVYVEYIRPEPVREDIAERFFSRREASRLRALPPDEQVLAFFRCWTRKEAFLKASGLGLSQPLDQFEVSLAPDEPAALLKTHWDSDKAACWSLREIDIGPKFVATLAVSGHDLQVGLSQVATAHYPNGSPEE